LVNSDLKYLLVRLVVIVRIEGRQDRILNQLLECRLFTHKFN